MDASSDEGVVTEEVIVPRRVMSSAAEPWNTDALDGVSTLLFCGDVTVSLIGVSVPRSVIGIVDFIIVTVFIFVKKKFRNEHIRNCGVCLINYR